MKTITTAISLFICSMGMLSADKPAPAKNEVIATPEKLVAMLLDQYIVQEINAKNVTVAEACTLLDREVKAHLAGMKSEFVLSGLACEDSSDLKNKKLFFHVKGLSLRMVIMIINAQTNSKFKIVGSRIVLCPHDTD